MSDSESKIKIFFFYKIFSGKNNPAQYDNLLINQQNK